MTDEEKKRVAKRTADLEELFAPCEVKGSKRQMAATLEETYLGKREKSFEAPDTHQSFDPAQVQPDLNE